MNEASFLSSTDEWTSTATTYCTNKCLDFWLNCELAVRFAASKKFVLLLHSPLNIRIYVKYFVHGWIGGRASITIYNKINVISSKLYAAALVIMNWYGCCSGFIFIHGSWLMVNVWSVAKKSSFFSIAILFPWRLLSLFSKFQTIIWQ